MSHPASVKARIVAIGNSQGIRIPKPLLEQAGLTGDVELRQGRARRS
jgi:antitoxin MazE